MLHNPIFLIKNIFQIYLILIMQKASDEDEDDGIVIDSQTNYSNLAAK